MAGKRSVRLDSLGHVRKFLGKVINQVWRDELDHQKASKIGYLANILIQAIEKDDVEKRLAVLEEKLSHKWEAQNAHIQEESREARAAN